MNEESNVEGYRLGKWSVKISPDKPSPIVYERETEKRIAIVHGDEKEALSRAWFIARAPALLDAVRGSLKVFQVIAEHDPGRAGESAKDMIPCLESSLYGIEDDNI